MRGACALTRSRPASQYKRALRPNSDSASPKEASRRAVSPASRAAAAFTAVGVLTSALTDSPLLAAFLAFVLLLTSVLAGIIGDAFGGPGAAALGRLSILHHVAPFQEGVIDLGAVAWLVLGTAGLIFTTQRVLESRRWR